MAEKRIIDLILRDDVTDAVNFAVDDTIQAYRVTALQLYAYVRSFGLADSYDNSRNYAVGDFAFHSGDLYQSVADPNVGNPPASSPTQWTSISSIASGTKKGLFPPAVTSLDDVLATQLGLKTYRHGTNYNGGNAPTISTNNSLASFSVGYSMFQPRMDQDGVWFLKAKGFMSFSSTNRADFSFGINGILFRNTANAQRTGHATGTSGNADSRYVTFNHNEANFVLIFTSSQNHTSLWFEFDAELESKPTWAY